MNFKFVVFSLQQTVKNLSPTATNYKLCTTNYKVKGASHDGKNLRATVPVFLSVPQFSQPDAQFGQAPFGRPPDEAFVPMVDAAYFSLGADAPAGRRTQFAIRQTMSHGPNRL